MFRNLISTLVFSLTILLSAVTLTATVEAQQQFQDGGTVQEQTVPNQTGATTQDDGFNWLWLLPLLALPLLFLLKREDGEEEQTQRHNQGYAGIKGGETYRNRDDDEE